MHRPAVNIQMSRDYEPVAAVIAFAAVNDDRLPLRVEAHEDFGGAAAGVFHQHDAGDAVLLDRPPIEFADLFAAERHHDTTDPRRAAGPWSNAAGRRGSSPATTGRDRRVAGRWRSRNTPPSVRTTIGRGPSRR